MKPLGILFSGPMVRAILDGRKTQTRRTVKPQPDNMSGAVWQERGGLWYQGFDTLGRGMLDPICPGIRAPYGPVGRRLWVRETWACSDELLYQRDRQNVVYRADVYNPFRPPIFYGDKWRPSLLMPRWASRLTLAVTRIRVERVQDISEEDARAEGMDWASPYLTKKELRCADDDREDPREVGYGSGSFARTNYAKLWDEINGAWSWAANQFAWVYDFEVVRS